MFKKKRKTSIASWGCRPGTAKYERALNTYNYAPKTVRTPAQQKAYQRWKAQNETEQQQKAARVAENAQLLEKELRKKYRDLSEREQIKAIKIAKKKEAVGRSQRPYVHIVSGGLPSLGKR